MTNPVSRLQNELNAIEKKRSLIVITSGLAMAALAVAYLQSPVRVMIVFTVVILISVKKAVVRYRELGERKSELRHELSSDMDLKAP